jgi:hypothetical protein
MKKNEVKGVKEKLALGQPQNLGLPAWFHSGLGAKYVAWPQ